MKRKIFSTLFALVLLASFSLMTAAPVAAAAADAIPKAAFTVNNATAAWSQEEIDEDAGDYSVTLSLPVGGGSYAVAQIFLPSGTTLADLTGMSYKYFVDTLGSDPVDVGGIDVKGVGTQFEPVYQAPHLSIQFSVGEVPGGIVQHEVAVLTGDAWAVDTIEATEMWHGTFDGLNHTFADYLGLYGDVEVPSVCLNLSKNGVAEHADPVAALSYVDTITIGGVTYDLEPRVINTDTGEGFNTIQAAIDDAETLAGHTINVAAGTYDEQVAIGKALTLEGAGDTTVIQPSAELTPTTSIPWLGGSTGLMSAIVSVVTTGDEVTIRNLKIDASLITSKSTLWVGGLVYLETSGTIENLTVTINSALPDRTAGIFAGAITETTKLVEVTGCNVIGYNRAGIYAVGGTLEADYHHNKINGPGDISGGVPNGIYFLEHAKGSATYNTITDLGYTEEQYLSTGIGVYEAGEGVTLSHNEIFNVQMAFCLALNSSGTIVEYNDIHDCQTGVKLEGGAADHTIQYNDIHDNDFAIRCGKLTPGGLAEMGSGNVAHYNDFVNNPGLEWTNEVEASTYVGAVCNLSSQKLDATDNWWGNASGPKSPLGEPPLLPPGYESYGDKVSAHVDFEPWLLEEDGETFEKTLALRNGWTLVSTDQEVGSGTDWVGTTIAYEYTGTGYEQIDYATQLTPVDAYYVKTVGGGGVGINYSTDQPGVVTKDLVAGWNLIGCTGSAADWEGEYLSDAYTILSQLRHVQIGQQQGCGLTSLVGQTSYNQFLPYPLSLALVDKQVWWAIEPYEGDNPIPLNAFDGFWVYMNAAKSFGVIPD